MQFIYESKRSSILYAPMTHMELNFCNFWRLSRLQVPQIAYIPCTKAWRVFHDKVLQLWVTEEELDFAIMVIKLNLSHNTCLEDMRGQVDQDPENVVPFGNMLISGSILCISCFFLNTVDTLIMHLFNPPSKSISKIAEFPNLHHAHVEALLSIFALRFSCKLRS